MSDSLNSEGEPLAPETHTPSPEVRRRKILVAVDEGEESIHALVWAIENLILAPNDAQTLSDTVVLMHVQSLPRVILGPAGPGDFFISPEIMESVRRQQDETSRGVLLRAKMICDKKHIHTETTVTIGDPRDGICEAVEKLHPDLLVIGSHGFGAFKRAFLGSVSDYCAHNAKCPVVIVKKP